MINTPALHDRIFYLSQEFTDPERTEWAMQSNLKSNLKLQQKIVTRDTLQRLVEVGTNDVVNVSSKIGKLITNDKENVQKKIIRFLMKLKLEDANKEVEKAKKEVTKNKIHLRRYMREGTFVAAEYRETLENVCRKSWDDKRKAMQEKVNHIRTKRKHIEKLPGRYEGINVGDKEIGEIETTNEPRIHGNFDFNEAENKILTMLPNETTYNKIDINKIDDEVEICFAKDRYGELKNDSEETDSSNMKTYDSKTNTMNFNNMKATDMKVNKRVKMMMPVESEIETKRSNLKVEILKVSKDFIDEKCDSKGNLKKSNFSTDEIKATESLSKKADNLEAVITTTDKSSKFSVLEPNIYIESMKPHTTKDRKINKKELKRVVNLMNETSKSLNKIIGTGKDQNQEKRILSNVIVSQYPEIPVLSGSDKDHKECKKDEVKMRPIVNAMTGPKKALSETYSKLINCVVESDKTDTVCKNTEELLEAFEKFNEDKNNKDDTETFIIGSMDAVSLYPSLEVNRVEEIVRQQIIGSKINIEGIDVMEMGKYLRKNMDTNEIKEKGFEELLPKNIKKKNNKMKNENKQENTEIEIKSLFDEDKDPSIDGREMNPEKMDENKKDKALSNCLNLQNSQN